MVTTKAGPLEVARFTDLDVDATVEYLVGAPCTLYGLVVDNTQNTLDVFLKIWDAASGVTIGMTAPIFVLRVRAGERLPIPLGSSGGGAALAAGLAVACVTTGGTAGSTAAPNDVKATLLTD